MTEGWMYVRQDSGPRLLRLLRHRGYKVQAYVQKEDTEAEDTWDMTQLLSVRVDTDMVADANSFALRFRDRTLFVSGQNNRDKNTWLEIVYSSWKMVPPVMEGYMEKEGGNIKTWKRRWLVLRGCSLMYFKNKETYEQGQSPLGVVDVQNCPIEVTLERPRKPFCLKIKSKQQKGREFFVATDSQGDMTRWMVALQEVSAFDNSQLPGRTEVDVIHAGHTKKKRTLLSNVNRWTVLDADSLKFFNNVADKEPAEMFFLANSKWTGRSENKSIKFVEGKSNNSITFLLETIADYEKWLEALGQAKELNLKRVAKVRSLLNRGSTPLTYFMRWRSATSKKGMRDFDFKTFSLSLPKRFQFSHSTDNSSIFKDAGVFPGLEGCGQFQIAEMQPNSMEGNLYRTEFAQLRYDVMAFLGAEFPPGSKYSITVSKNVTSSGSGASDLTAYTSWMVAAESEDTDLALALIRRKHLPPFGNEYRDYLLRCKLDKHAVEVEKERWEEENRRIAEEIAVQASLAATDVDETHASEQDPLLGGESSQSGGVGASSSSGTDPDAPHDEDLENLGLGTEKRRIRSVDILSASQIVQHAASSFHNRKDMHLDDYDIPSIQTQMQQFNLEERMCGWALFYLDVKPTIWSMVVGFVESLELLLSGRPPRMDFVQELKRIFEHGKAQFQNVQGVASATEIRLRIARFLALALDMGVMDEVSFERIFRVARSPKTPEQWRNQLHTLMAVVCAVHDEDGSRLEPEGEVRAQGEKVALTTTLEEVVYSRRWFSLQPWALARLLNCRYVDYCLLSKAELHREITSSTQAQVSSGVSGSPSFGVEATPPLETEGADEYEVPSFSTSTQQMEVGDSFPVAGEGPSFGTATGGGSDAVGQREAVQGRSKHVRAVRPEQGALLGLILLNDHLISKDLKIEVCKNMAIHCGEEDVTRAFVDTGVMEELLQLLKVDDTIMRAHVLRLLVNLTCSVDGPDARVVENDYLAVLHSLTLHKNMEVSRLAAMVLANTMDSLDLLRQHVEQGTVRVIGERLRLFRDASTQEEIAVVHALLTALWGMARTKTGKEVIMSTQIIDTVVDMLTSSSERILERLCGIIMTLSCQSPETCSQVGAKPNLVERVVRVMGSCVSLRLLRASSTCLYFLFKDKDSKSKARRQPIWRNALIRVQQNLHDPRIAKVHRTLKS